MCKSVFHRIRGTQYFMELSINSIQFSREFVEHNQYVFHGTFHKFCGIQFSREFVKQNILWNLLFITSAEFIFPQIFVEHNIPWNLLSMEFGLPLIDEFILKLMISFKILY